MPVEANYQGEFERDIMDILPKEFKQFFPAVEYFGRIIAMDEIKVAIDMGLEDSGSCSSIANWRASNLYTFVVNQGLYFEEDIFEDFLVWFAVQGGEVEDILDNTGNFGYDPEDCSLKIIDWGWSEWS